MSTGNQILAALERVAGPVDWCRCITAETPEQATRPPMTAFRLRHDRRDLWPALQQAVDSFKGRVSWSASRVDRNWVIQPTAVATYEKRGLYNNDVQIAIAFFAEHPDLVRAAYEDVPELAACLELTLGDGSR